MARTKIVLTVNAFLMALLGWSVSYFPPKSTHDSLELNISLFFTN